MIVRGQTLTIVVGDDWRNPLEILGPEQRVRLDGGMRRHMWSASCEDGSHLDFSISWFHHDGWHIHATSRGSSPGIVLSQSWRERGGLSVRIVSTNEQGRLIELRRIEP